MYSFSLTFYWVVFLGFFFFLDSRSDVFGLCRSLFSSASFQLLKMATTAASSLQMAAARPCISSSHKAVRESATMFHTNSKATSWTKVSSACHISSIQSFQRTFTSSSIKFDKVVTKAMAETSEIKPDSGLPIDLKGWHMLLGIFYSSITNTTMLTLHERSDPCFWLKKVIQFACFSFFCM